MLLIVGSTGLIGRALCQEAGRAGRVCIGTSPEPGAPCYLELKNPPESWRIPAGIDQAILCAAITELAACEADPAGTRAVNVVATLALADLIAARGGTLAFLSSTQVFPPEANAPGEDSPPAPATEYGRQKFAVEQDLLERWPGTKIIRLTKVVSPTIPLFADWAQALVAGRSIRAYRDLYFSPLALPVAAAAILRIAAASAGGVFHLGAADSISYFEAARWIAARLGASPTLVRAEGAPRPNTPDSCRLACVRTQQTTGFRPAPVVLNLAAAFADEIERPVHPPT
jgi:dTDP-4-dehydrorhamnose reductase